MGKKLDKLQLEIAILRSAVGSLEDDVDSLQARAKEQNEALAKVTCATGFALTCFIEGYNPAQDAPWARDMTRELMLIATSCIVDAS